MDKKRYNRIKAELAEAGKQNKDLAEYMDLHVTTISDWCTNTNQPSLQHLYKIAEFLKIDVRRLLVPERQDMDDYLSIVADKMPFFTKEPAPGRKKRKAGNKPKNNGKG